MTKPWFTALECDLTKARPPIPAESVDVACCSPPYKKKDGYSIQLMRELGHLVGTVLKPGGLFFLNFGQLSEDFDRPYEVQRTVRKHSGLETRQTIIWVKSIAMPDKDSPESLSRGHFQPINSDKILNYCWEPIFVFAKPPVPAYDKLSVGVPYADPSNLKRGTRGKNGNLHCGGDTWFIPHKTTGAKQKKEHKDEFPEELVRRCLKLANLQPGATVYEPFLGGGTTAKVALEMGFNVYGTDMNPDAIAAAEKRCEGLT